MKAFRFLARHPLLVVGALALTAYIMPKRWISVLQKGLLPWGISLAGRYLLKEN
jgi:hypothetical protein